VQQWIEERMLTHVTTLKGLQAFWAGSNSGVTKEEFSAYTASLNLLNDYPGISSVAFFERRGEKLITVYIEPLADRETALGFDHNTRQERKAFLEQVRDSGEILSSQPFTLVTTNRPGFFLTAPLYRGGETPRSIDERRSQLIGFVNLAFRDADLFTALFGRQNPMPDIDFAIFHDHYDSPPGTEHLLFDSDPEFDPMKFPALLHTKKYVTVGNASWTIFVTAKPSLVLTAAEENLPKATLIIGLTFSALFFLANLYFYRLHLKRWHD